MPTAPEHPAASAARTEAATWARLAGWAVPWWEDVAPTEVAVVAFFDPAGDLDRRAHAWGHRFADHGLASLAAFAAGLAHTEAEAWEGDDPVVATRAYATRRHLLGDRILHWAVPWLDAAGRCYPQLRDVAHGHRDALLGIGDRHRPAPDLGASLALPGEDGYGPVDVAGPPALRSIWSGMVLLDATVASLGGTLDGTAVRRDLATLYQVAAGRWRSMAAVRPGSAALWRDLAARADATGFLMADTDPT
jgi:hypothetical protein